MVDRDPGSWLRNGHVDMTDNPVYLARYVGAAPVVFTLGVPSGFELHVSVREDFAEQLEQEVSYGVVAGNVHEAVGVAAQRVHGV